MMRQKMYLNEKLEEARDFELDKLRQMEQAILSDATSGDHAAIKLVLRIMEMRRKYLKDIPLEHVELFPSIEDRAELLAEVVDVEWERNGRPGEEAEPSESGSCEEQAEEDRERKTEDKQPLPAELARKQGTAAELARKEAGRGSFVRSTGEGGSCGKQANEEDEPSRGRKPAVEDSVAAVDRETAEEFLARMWQRAAEAVQQPLAAQQVTANVAASTEASTRESTDGSKDGSREESMAVEGTKAEGKGGRTNGAWRAY